MMRSHQPRSRVTQALLWGGILAGPVFLLTNVGQILTRAGYDFASQPISLLSLGDGGWVQIANFIVGGILVLGVAVATQRTLSPHQRLAWVPFLLGGFGGGLILAGLFPPDPAFGFPPGTPDGMPVVTFHSVLHGVGFTLSFGCVTAACVVLAVQEAKKGHGVFFWYSVLTAAGSLLLSQWPGMDGASLRYFLAAVVVWIWIGVISLRLLKTSSQPAQP